MTQEKTTTNPLWTNARSWWLLQVVAVSVVLVLASLLSKHPVAAQSPAKAQYEATEPTSSATASPTKPGAETNQTAPSSDTHNEDTGGDAFDPAQEAPRTSTPSSSEVTEDPSANNSAPPSESKGGQVTPGNTSSPGDPNSGSDSEPIVPSILPDNLFSHGEPGTGNTTVPSAPQAAVEGLHNRLKELEVALESLMATMMRVFPFEGEQHANPEADTNTTAPPSDTQNTPVQQDPALENAPGSSEVGEDTSANSAPQSVSNDGQVPSGNTSSSGDPNAQEQPKGCGDASVLTPEEARECLRVQGDMRTGDWGGMGLH